MERYFVESPHTSQECLRALDEILAKGPGVLAKYEWGCMAGDHTGYAIVEARSESEAKETIPAFLGGKARVVKLNRFTPDQIREFHRKSARPHTRRELHVFRPGIPFPAIDDA